MKKSYVCLVMLVLGLLVDTVLSYSGGDGSAERPYQINSVDDLLQLGSTTTDYDKCFVMTADIDLADAGTVNKAVLASFTGKFNGNGKTISNLTISGPEEVGFFGKIGSGGEVFSLTLENVNVTGSYCCVGGLCGINYGAIDDCRVTGSVTGYSTEVGGLCGWNGRTISNCDTEVVVTGGEGSGGLCGKNHQGTITGCYSASTVNSYNAFAGGLCGLNESGASISRCYSAGEVNSQNLGHGYGGLVGKNESSTIIDSYSTCCVSGSGGIGGLCGYSFGIIRNCYATGSVSGDNNIGGLCGQSDGIVSNCYATGGVSGVYNIGGLCGYGYVDVENCFWDVNTSSIGNAGDSNYGATGLTTAAMQSRDTFVDAGWDLIGETANGTDDIWQMEGYPVFVPCGPTEAFEVHIGTAQYDSIFPLRTSRLDCRTQSIYTAEQVGHAGLIQSLSLDIVSAPGQTMNNFTIRLKHTQLNEYEFTPTSPAWESEGWTVVYQADQTIDHTGDFEFVFSTPFAYNGTDNLMVDISFNNEEFNSTNGSDGYCWSTSRADHVCRTVVCCANNEYGDPQTWSGSGMPIPDGIGLVPDISLIFSDGGNSEYSTVPDLAGLTQEQAESEVIAAGLSVGAITHEYSKTVVAYNVISQSLPAGNRVKKDRQINFVVSIGNSLPGSGWQYDPYIIDSLAGFKYFCENTDYWGQGVCVRLDTNIDLSGKTYYLAPIAGDFGFGNTYRGNFDGNSHVISNLAVSGYSSCGLFGSVDYANIYDLGLEDVNITGDYYVGGLCGNAFCSDITNCHVSGTISGSASGNYVGGLCGASQCCTIEGCYAEGVVICLSGTVGGLCGNGSNDWVTGCHTAVSVNGSDSVGGLYGEVTVSVITSCYATGNVKGTGGYTGGLCGSSQSNTIRKCYATGSVTGYSGIVGGLCGYNTFKIAECYATGDVTGNGCYFVGGLCGGNVNGEIFSCYATGSVTGNGSGEVGGFCGDNTGDIIGSYAIGNVKIYGVGDVGGFCGYNCGSVFECFWDLVTSGNSNGVGYGPSSGISGLNTADMQNQSTFITAGWDFSTADGDAADWQMKAGCYPLLDWQVTDGDVAGSEAVDMEDLEYLAANWLSEAVVADMDGDSVLDLADFAVLAGNWLK